MTIYFVMMMSLLLFAGGQAQQAKLQVIPNPSTCNYHAVNDLVASSTGFIIVDISSTYSSEDLLVTSRNVENEIGISTTVYSDRQGDITNLAVSNSSHYSTFIYSVSYNGAITSNKDASCSRKVVVNVAIPDTVHYICWNKVCSCNCAVKGAGVNIHFTSPLAGELDMLSAAGFGYTRMDFQWGAIETTKGKYDWASYDVLVDALAPYDITPYFILDYSNRFYDNGTSPINSEGRDAFANFAVNSTMFYEGKGFVWELYNEPNIGFWTPSPNVTQYVELGQVVGPRLKERTPREIFVGPAVANTGSDIDGLDVNFLRACFQGGLLEYWDALSFHAYRQDNPETVVEELRALKQMLNPYMPSSKNFVGLISGEWGYSTTWPGIDDFTQGEYIVREMLTNLANEVAVSIWYDWHDDGTDPSNAEHNFGTTYNPFYPGRTPCYDPKPAYITRKIMQSNLGSKRFNKRIWLGNEDIWVLLFNTAGEDDYVITAWTTNTQENSTVQIPSSSSSTFQIISMFGVLMPAATAQNGYLTLTVSTSPLYATSTSSNPLLSLIGSTTRLLADYVAPSGWFTFTWNVPNPTSSSISVGLNGTSLTASLSSGDTAVFSQDVFVTREAAYQEVIVTINNSLGPSFSMYTAIASSNPLEITVEPADQRQVQVIVGNPSGSEFQGEVIFSTSGAHGQSNQTVKLVLASQQFTITIPFNVESGNLTEKYFVSVSILDESNAVVLSSSNTYEMMDDYSKFPEGSTPKTYEVEPNGDPKVESNFTLIASTPPGGPDGIASLALHYSMNNGWKFFMIHPLENSEIEGIPVAIGCWVYVESNQGDYARLQIVDSTGQTFQFTYAQLSWSSASWQYVSISTAYANAEIWGGAGDGVFHLPLKLATSFLLDSSQTAQSGVIYFTPPVLIYS